MPAHSAPARPDPPMASTPSATPPRPQWRADIEGLRGVAVLLVVLYHLRIPGFSGGYVGVDVFFVLSGYLITGILVAEAERTGQIDLARFFARRIRRLLPAAALVLFATCAAVFYFYAPFEHVAVLKTARATALYYSNIHFAGTALDYHEADAALNPLLHTWSLAVEEQFYLAWPVLVLLALVGFRERADVIRRGRLVLTVAAVVVLALGLSVYLMTVGKAYWAFFSPQARAWEFGVGALATLVAVPDGRRLAGLRFRGRPLAPSAMANGLGWLGLAGVLGASTFYTDLTPFPGWMAVPPVVGTALLLRAGGRAESSVLLRGLSWRPLRELGRLSYSWYLWHWPVLVLVEGVLGTQPTGVRIGLGLAALALAELTYRAVEHPVRHARLLAGRPAWGFALLLLITAASVGAVRLWEPVVVEQLNDAAQSRYGTANRETYERHIDSLGCTPADGSLAYAECQTGPADADTTLFYFGDSHAADLHVAMVAIAEERGWAFRSSIKQACLPWVAVPYITFLRGLNLECAPWRDDVLTTIREIQPEIVVIKGAGSYRIEPTPWDIAVDSLYAQLSPLSGVVLDFRSLPSSPFEPAACLARAAWRGKPATGCSVPADSPPESWLVRQQVASTYPNVFAADFTSQVCPLGICPAEIGTDVVYRDRTHLTASFAITLAPLIEAEIDTALHRVRAEENGARQPRLTSLSGKPSGP